MLAKDHEGFIELFRLIALDGRLIFSHQMKRMVQVDLKIKRSSIRGEKEVDFPLSFLNEKEFIILHNVRIPDDNGYFQIDTLILCKRYGLILEVKNWSGTVVYGENGQVTRIDKNNVEEGFPNPIPQAKLQRHRLQKWLRQNGFPNIPIEYFIVISFPSTIIRSAHPNFPIPKKVIHNDQLLFEIQNLDEKYREPLIKKDILIHVSEQLVKEHKPPNDDILAKYNLSKDDLIKGVICPGCIEAVMVWHIGNWYCRKCMHSSTDAHIGLLNDYKLLIGDTISNQEARDFLQIKSPNVAKKLLQKENFAFHGKTKDRKYKIQLNEMYFQINQYPFKSNNLF